MFFSWYAENKHFKRGHNLSGQIMPFLLVIIAIFLGAAVATVQIGKSALDMTCSDNAADACSLAAASMWARALNELKASNVGLRNNYATYNSLLQTLTTISNQQLANAKIYMDLAKSIIAAANSGGGLWPCSVWGHAHTSATLLRTAATLLRTAATFVTTAKIVNSMLQTITDAWKMSQQGQFCGLMAGMQTKNNGAINKGIEYAQQFNCAGTLPSVGEVPDITSFELEVTKRNNPCPTLDPYGIIKFSALIPKLNNLADDLDGDSNAQISIYNRSVDTHNYCVYAAALATNPVTLPIALIYYNWAAYLYAINLVGASHVSSSISSHLAILNNIINGPPSVQSMIDFNKEISKALGAAGGPGAGRIVSVVDCFVGGDMLIIGINHVTFARGCVSCTVNGSKSSAAFSDTNFGIMDPRFFGVGFTPRLTGDSCPGNGGVTTGVGTPGDTSESGC